MPNKVASISAYARSVMVVLATLFFLISCRQEEEPKLPSASENVEILKHPFTIADLNRERTVRLYLPPEYADEDKRYPVIYMHDGQNLFDDATSYAGEWGVDETLNRLYRDEGLSLIVVGIDNGHEKRMSELTYWKNDGIDGVEGEQYMNFVVNQVKPYIDKNYRTLAGAEHTAVMGSSMGGLISHYAAFRYPDIFSKVGIFSPSYWVSEEIYPFSTAEKLAANTRLYLLLGGDEGTDTVEEFEKMTQYLSDQGLNENQLKSKIVAGGDHSEHFWRTEFPEAVLWMFEEHQDHPALPRRP